MRADELDRTEKMALDTGEAANIDEARLIFAGYRLQIAAGREVAASAALQAALLTAVNAGCRAFKGGVDVCLESPNAESITPWGRGASLAEAVFRHGGRPVDHLQANVPTLVLGDAERLPDTEILLFVRPSAWVACVSPSSEPKVGSAAPTTLAAIASAGLGVSECFQSIRGDLVPGHRDIGISLWRPDLDWRDPDALGAQGQLLPAEWWLIGLGHLGQAYAWVIGSLPFPEPNRVKLMLQDVDILKPANRASALLAADENLGERKTRRVAAALEALGFEPLITERRLDGDQTVASGEPVITLAGLDDPQARRRVLMPGCQLAIDVGLGGGPRDYLEMQLHTFPAVRNPEDVFTVSARSEADVRGERLLESAQAYRDEDRNGADRCGLIQVAGRAVATAFVGVTAASLAIAEAVRPALGGVSCEVIDLSLRNPQHRECIVLEGEREVRWAPASASAL